MIVKLKPALKSYLWGGKNLKTQYGKVSNQDTVAESWELSFNPVGPSVIDSGEHCGRLLADVVTKCDLGANVNAFADFPVMVKLIDSAQNLSVQVHPSDDYALKNEGQYGKTEVWYILNAEADAFIYLGLNKNVTEQELSSALKNGTVCSLLNKIPVHRGETYFIESGTIHSIGAGVTLAEIQQNSTLTYRLYDFDRVDADGNKRPLHIEKALKVAALNKYEISNTVKDGLLCKCKYFSAYRYNGDGTVGRDDSFVSVTVIEGEMELNGLVLKKGETAFLSSGEHASITGNGSYILVCVEKE